MPRKVFTAGEILTAADVNTNLMDQAVMVFDDSAARGSAIPTPSEGMVTYLKDVNQVQAFNGSAFAPLGTILQVVSTAKTDRYSVSLGSTATDSSDVTGLSASITPSSASNKVLVILDFYMGSGNRRRFGFKLRRNSADIALGDSGLSATLTGADQVSAVVAAGGGQVGTTFLDSPATTSAVTYSVRLQNLQTDTQTIVVNSLSADVSAATISTITLMEVAG